MAKVTILQPPKKTSASEEQELDEIMAARVAGGRVIYVLSQGFWALIPHWQNRGQDFEHWTLSCHYLGERYTEAYAMLNRCWPGRA